MGGVVWSRIPGVLGGRFLPLSKRKEEKEGETRARSGSLGFGGSSSSKRQ